MTNRDNRAITVMYTNYQGNILSDEPTNMTAYPIYVTFDELGMVVVFPTPSEIDAINRAQSAERKTDI